MHKRVFMNDNKPDTAVSGVISKDAARSWPWLARCVSRILFERIYLLLFVCVKRACDVPFAGQRGTAWRHAWVMRWMSSRLSRLPSSFVITYAVVGSSFLRLSVCVCVLEFVPRQSVLWVLLWRTAFMSACGSRAYTYCQAGNYKIRLLSDVLSYITPTYWFGNGSVKNRICQTDSNPTSSAFLTI